MKRKTTKEILAESFMELSAGKPINKITIAEIADNCSMTSTTFYRHFKDKYDLIVWIYISEAQKNVDRIGHGGYVWKDTLLDGLRYYAENRKYMINALKHTSGRDSFINQMTKLNIGYIMDEVRKKTGRKNVNDDLVAMIKIYCYGTGQYLCEWLMNDKPSSCEEAAEAMEACIPEKLRPYLCR
ncbi:MAG: TetR/AcrR family transcriptional regulator C-terminal domain-containing protein [Clostridia bacterium]|nr:TetR/AcrR family transcriptional regulator C-terminal domain-containing protein [Clostridia bacterium]